MKAGLLPPQVAIPQHFAPYVPRQQPSPHAQVFVPYRYDFLRNYICDTIEVDNAVFSNFLTGFSGLKLSAPQDINRHITPINSNLISTLHTILNIIHSCSHSILPLLKVDHQHHSHNR
jgi:hypothetical protein